MRGGGGRVEEEQASSYRLTIRVHNDLQRANRRLQIHTIINTQNNCYEMKYKLTPICTKQTQQLALKDQLKILAPALCSI